MTDSFNRVYGEPDTPFYYGLNPSEELEQFLNDTHSPTGEAYTSSDSFTSSSDL